MHQPTLQSLVDGAIELFSLPDIYFQVNEMISDPRFSVENIGRVIAKDPALSARLLKVVNSPFYGFQAKIDTVSRAIVVIGIDDLKNLILATSVVDKFNKIPCELVDMTTFWMHSVNCGVIAKLLAKESLVLHSERLFLAGLLHNIGSLVLYHKMPNESLKVLLAADNDRNLIGGLEQEIIGFNHAEMSGELIKSWGLPESLYEAIACYLNPAAAQVHKLDAYLLSLAAFLVNASDQGLVIEDVIDELDQRQFSLIHLKKDQILGVVHQAESDFSQLFELMAPNKKFH